jgi:hypothetical protein
MNRCGVRWLLATAFAWGLSLVGTAALHAAPIYNIVSFDANDATTSSSTSVMYDPNLVTITVAPGLSGTTASQLLSLQTVNSAAGTGKTGARFQNTDVDAAQTNGTLIVDPSANYMQFGVGGGAGGIRLDSLTFQAKKATTSVSTRGYNVVVSVDGGAYTALGSANLTADRNSPAFDSVSLSLTGPAFQGISSVDFRVNTTGSNGVEYTNFAINGTTPEPSAIALLGAAFTAASLRRRRRRCRGA